ncbi:protein eva-1-like [Episyrphus balteatus]|uniref:protein eva-1-like n=1 Tax=Episyrphus balteatus TaxID=286459 RepID=UPI002486B4B7|nr:protein eva-1-like [Episyrphus balteatus]XP_055852524.1 protein eva-1-like [Episyrphus balteatus]XP_055852525.1 protein eva-1-like [Episyrphus balteatus]
MTGFYEETTPTTPRRSRISITQWSIIWLLLTCLLSPVLPEVIYRVDPLALLAATLRTYQRAGCDSEQLSLSCPRGTSISIELAQYGRAGDLSDHSLCPPISQEDTTTRSDGVVHSGTEIEVKPAEACTVSGLQYILLQTVVDACHKKRHCKFAASAKSLPGDPCSGIRKFVEIAYKCRPYEFRSKMACENDNMPLVCNPYSRIAIYSASFGRTERESVQCSNGSDHPVEDASSKQTCLVSYATETVMQICHGRRRCSITADAGTFGRPCKGEAKMYLKVVYTCIPRKVLKDRYETEPESDEPQQTELDLDQDELYDEDQFYKESEAIPPAPKLQGAIPNPAFPFDFSGDMIPTSTLMPPLLSRNDNSLEENQEQFYLYLIISVAAGVLLCLTLVIGRLAMQKRRHSRKNSNSSGSNSGKNCDGKFQQSTTGETQIPNSFGDDISDIDGDIDLTSALPVPNLSSRSETYIAYAPTGYGGGMPPPPTSSATTMLMPQSHHSGMLGGGGPSGPVGNRQSTPPPNMYSGLVSGPPPVSGSMSMGPHMMPSAISSVSHHTSAGQTYIPGSMLMSGPHAHGTLRRTMIPTSMGMMSTPSPPPGMGGGNIYYDSTIPRNLNRGMSADNQYFYG